MRRRDFVLAAGATVLCCPTTVLAQSIRDAVIGYVNFRAPEHYPTLGALRQGMADVGIQNAQAIPIEYRWPGEKGTSWEELVQDLVRRRVTVICTDGEVSAFAAKRVTQDVPVVFVIGSDPVRQGIVASFARPGGNMTGVSNMNVELGPKRLEILLEIIPTARRLGVLANPRSAFTEHALQEMRSVARATAKPMIVYEASSSEQLASSFAAAGEAGIQALVIIADNFFHNWSKQIGILSLRHRVPAIYAIKEFVAAGGLVSYGTDLLQNHRQRGQYVGRMLKGEKPADLPVQQPTRFDLAINVKTAAALGIEVPPMMLARADEVIE